MSNGIIYKPTTIKRCSLVQELRVILQKDDGVLEGCYRHVQLLIPESPTVFVATDIMPSEVGLNRTYKLPEIPPGAAIRFDLLPEQFLIGASKIGRADLSIICEYRYDPGLAELLRQLRPDQASLPKVG